MKILYIEPYLADSHNSWIRSYMQHSKHDVEILSLSTRKWKWRMHGGSITLANKLNNSNDNFNLLLCSDFINLPVFKSLLNKKYQDTPFAIYFHENQPSYPWSLRDKDIALKRDFHYYYINQTSALASDWNFFNSSYNLNSFTDNLLDYLKKMPDNKNISSIQTIVNKSSVLPLGCELNFYDRNKKQKNNDIPVILWNHRWEYDKNPELFFSLLRKVREKKIDFNLILLGESFNESPDIFKKALKEFSEQIIHSGYCESKFDYSRFLWQSDILPVTSNQDFFGLSIVEAVYCDTYPLLPNRLSYPEIFCSSDNPDIFYNNEEELLSKMLHLLNKYKELANYSNLVSKFSWKHIVDVYDVTFEDLVKSSA